MMAIRESTTPVAPVRMYHPIVTAQRTSTQAITRSRPNTRALPRSVSSTASTGRAR